METVLVLTVIGPDRPGIVDSLSAAVVAHGGSWQRSRMAKLAGQFAGILEVAVDDAATDALRRTLAGLASDGLAVHVAGSEAVDAPVGPPKVQVSVVGHDRPGIMRALAHTLAARGINVLELESGCNHAPMSGDRMFEARALVQLPPGLATEELRADLEALAGDLMVDFGVDGP